jgi:hypothetical protein
VALAGIAAVREGRGGRRAWGWWGPRRGGATCSHETGSAAGRRAWGRVAGEPAGGRMRGLLACMRGRVDWCGDGVGRRGRVADWWPPLRRCPAEVPAGEGPGAAPRSGRAGGEPCVLGLLRGRACVHMRGRRCTQAIRPSAWSDVLRWCVCEHACLCGRMYALCHVCTQVPPFLSPISHQYIIGKRPTTDMVSQAMVHPFPRPPSLRVVSCPVSRLASVSSRRAATGIRTSIYPGQRPLTAIKGRYLRRG